ncbi:MarR family transcriptional regulator, partial [Streptomyces sp. 2MCAF27]
LLEEDPAEVSRVRLTAAGRELHESTSAETAEISARLYAGIPAEDLAVAGRVLALVTERANAELVSA